MRAPRSGGVHLRLAAVFIASATSASTTAEIRRSPTAAAASAAVPGLELTLCGAAGCAAPTELYRGAHERARNFAALDSAIPRATPDGVRPWPYDCTGDCTVPPTYERGQRLSDGDYLFRADQRAGWWDYFERQQALPTNAWFVSYFSSPLTVTNTRSWVWPV